jgi:thioredoxin-related protein
MKYLCPNPRKERSKGGCFLSCFLANFSADACRRYFVPILGGMALVALFLKLSEPSTLLHVFNCQACSVNHPYLTLFGSAYFAGLIAISILFPTFPGSQIARSGLICAVLLALVLTYIDFPHICTLCLIGHGCNIFIWTIWVAAPPINNKIRMLPFKKRLCFLLFISLSVVVLFSCLHLTLMRDSRQASSERLKIGDTVPVFSVQTSEGRMVSNTDANSRMIMNFISSDCPYCRQQLLVLNEIMSQIRASSYRFINIATELPKEVLDYSPGMEWVEDKTAILFKLFRVSGYPTLFVIGADSKMIQIVAGVEDDLKNIVLTTIFK